MTLTPKLLIVLVLIFLVGIILGILLLWRLRALWLRLKLQRQHSVAKLGESDAERLLQEAGYRIVARQARTPLQLLFDGTLWTTDIIADLLVEKDGRTFVAEVKTGLNAPDIRSSATRRQLLEYYVTYRPDGLLLVDMHARALHEVTFLLDL